MHPGLFSWSIFIVVRLLWDLWGGGGGVGEGGGGGQSAYKHALNCGDDQMHENEKQLFLNFDGMQLGSKGVGMNDS